MEILPTDTSRTVLQAREQFAAGKKLAEAPMPFSQARTMFAGGISQPNFLAGIQEKTAYVQQQKKFGEQLKIAESEFETQVKEVEKQYLEYLKTPAGVMEYAREKGVAPVVSQRTAKVGDQFITIPVRTYVTPYGSYTEEAEYKSAVSSAKGEVLKKELEKIPASELNIANPDIQKLQRTLGLGSTSDVVNLITQVQSAANFEKTMQVIKGAGFMPQLESGEKGAVKIVGIRDTQGLTEQSAKYYPFGTTLYLPYDVSQERLKALQSLDFTVNIGKEVGRVYTGPELEYPAKVTTTGGGSKWSLTTLGNTGYMGFGGFPGLIIPWIKKEPIEKVIMQEIPQPRPYDIIPSMPTEFGAPIITKLGEIETPQPPPKGGGTSTALEGSFLWKDIQGSFNQGVSSRVPSFNYQYPTTFNIPSLGGQVSMDKNLNIEDLRKSQAPDWYQRLQELQKKGEGVLQTTVGAVKEVSGDVFNIGAGRPLSTYNTIKEVSGNVFNAGKNVLTSPISQEVERQLYTYSGVGPAISIGKELFKEGPTIVKEGPNQVYTGYLKPAYEQVIQPVYKDIKAGVTEGLPQYGKGLVQSLLITERAVGETIEKIPGTQKTTTIILPQDVRGTSMMTSPEGTFSNAGVRVPGGEGYYVIGKVTPLLETSKEFDTRLENWGGEEARKQFVTKTAFVVPLVYSGGSFMGALGGGIVEKETEYLWDKWLSSKPELTINEQVPTTLGGELKAMGGAAVQGFWEALPLAIGFGVLGKGAKVVGTSALLRAEAIPETYVLTRATSKVAGLGLKAAGAGIKTISDIYFGREIGKQITETTIPVQDIALSDSNEEVQTKLFQTGLRGSRLAGTFAGFGVGTKVGEKSLDVGLALGGARVPKINEMNIKEEIPSVQYSKLLTTAEGKFSTDLGSYTFKEFPQLFSFGKEIKTTLRPIKEEPEIFIYRRGPFGAPLKPQYDIWITKNLGIPPEKIPELIPEATKMIFFRSESSRGIKGEKINPIITTPEFVTDIPFSQLYQTQLARAKQSGLTGIKAKITAFANTPLVGDAIITSKAGTGNVPKELADKAILEQATKGKISKETANELLKYENSLISDKLRDFGTGEEELALRTFKKIQPNFKVSFTETGSGKLIPVISDMNTGRRIDNIIRVLNKEKIITKQDAVSIRKNLELQEKFREQMIEPKQHTVYGHGKEVARYVNRLIDAYPELHPELIKEYGSLNLARKNLIRAGLYHDVGKLGESSLQVGRQHGERLYRVIKAGLFKYEIAPKAAKAIRVHELIDPRTTSYKFKEKLGLNSASSKILSTADRLNLERYGTKINIEQLPLPDAITRLEINPTKTTTYQRGYEGALEMGDTPKEAKAFAKKRFDMKLENAKENAKGKIGYGEILETTIGGVFGGIEKVSEIIAEPLAEGIFSYKGKLNLPEVSTTGIESVSAQEIIVDTKPKYESPSTKTTEYKTPPEYKTTEYKTPEEYKTPSTYEPPRYPPAEPPKYEPPKYPPYEPPYEPPRYPPAKPPTYVPPTIPPKSPPTIKPPVIIIGAFPDKTKQKLKPKKEGYEVFIRRKKIYQKESPFPLSKGEALTFGARKVISSAAATFQLRASKEEAKSLGIGSGPELSKMFRAPKKLERPETYVQKEKQRITTLGEKKEISFKGVEARKGIPATNYLKSKASKSRRSFFK